ncbi:MAG: thiamine pyrophosphate-dependent enzyme, partial [Deinococcota bacterium]
PWSTDAAGRGPAWSNSLFEDNAEFGLGMRFSLDKQMAYAKELLERVRLQVGDDLVNALLAADQSNDTGINAQRERVAVLKDKLASATDAVSLELLNVADKLVKKSVWLVGGDGWAYDIGYGGLDHVLASGYNVNALVLDTEVYSNTGGQASKATGLAAVAKFAAGGKATPKKDLGMISMSYGYIYVAQIAMGASDAQTVKAFIEAESYDGPSLIIAYSHCIAHGINMAKGMDQQKLAVQSGYWPLYRYDPRRTDAGKNPFQLDSRAPKVSFRDYALNETRYRMLTLANPDNAETLFDAAQANVDAQWQRYQALAQG